MNILKIPLLFLAIALGAALSWWLQDLRESFDEAPAPIVGGPDTTLDEAVMTVMDKTGTPQYRVRTPHLAHFSDDGHAELETPRMVYFRPDAPPLKLRSERARIASDGDIIHLLGDVHLMRPADGGRAALTIDTRNVVVRPKPQTAVTAEPAVAVSDQYRIRGQGLRADLDAGTVELLSDVKGTYEP